MHPKHYKEHPELIDEFKHLVASSFTFVDDWSNPEITLAAYRLYSKKVHSEKAAKDFTLKVQNLLSPEDVRISSSRDTHIPHNIHQEWQVASESVRVI